MGREERSSEKNKEQAIPWYRKKTRHEFTIETSEGLEDELKELANKYRRTTEEVEEKIVQLGLTGVRVLDEGGVVIIRDQEGEEHIITDIFDEN